MIQGSAQCIDGDEDTDSEEDDGIDDFVDAQSDCNCTAAGTTRKVGLLNAVIVTPGVLFLVERLISPVFARKPL